jgi:hypothetical protein
MGSHCHSHGAANGGVVYLQGVRSCGSPELQAANLPSADKRSSLQRFRGQAFSGAPGVHSVSHFLPSAANFAFIGADLESSPHSSSGISAIVLRV